MPTRWQLDRSELNHQWLKNELSRHLRAFLARIGSTEPDQKRIEDFALEDWPKLAANRPRLLELLASAEEALSPATLFEGLPLSRCPEEARAWLVPLVHSLWIARTPVRSDIGEAEVALDAVTQRHAQLDALLRARDVERLRSARDCFVALEAELLRLSSCLSRLPHQVQVV